MNEEDLCRLQSSFSDVGNRFPSLILHLSRSYPAGLMADGGGSISKIIMESGD